MKTYIGIVKLVLNKGYPESCKRYPVYSLNFFRLGRQPLIALSLKINTECLGLGIMMHVSGKFLGDEYLSSAIIGSPFLVRGPGGFNGGPMVLCQVIY